MPAILKYTDIIVDKGNGALAAGKDTPKLANAAKDPQAPARLTLLEAVAVALQQNQKIQVASYNPLRAVQDLKGAEAVYDSSVFSSANLNRVKRPTQSLLDTGTMLEDKLIERKWFARAGVKKYLPSGATVSLYQELDHLNSNSTLVIPDPQATSRVILEVAQPLLRGVFDQTNRAAISIAKLGITISNEEFRQLVMDVASEVSKVYWQLALERRLEVILTRNVGMAEEVYRREQVRLEQGLSTQLDADRALAATETRRADLLRTQTRIRMVSDQLKLLLNVPETLADLMPVDRPRIQPLTVDLNEALETALKNRPELERAKKTVGVSQARKDLAQHNRLPKLDAVFRLTRSGLGAGAGKAVDTVYGDNNNGWLAALEFEYPWGNRAPQAEYTKRKIEYDQALTEVRRVKEQIGNEVSLGVREIQLAQKEIPTTRQAQEAAERVVASEHVRFELGQKTNEELLRAQDLLTAAEREYLRAVINYNINAIAMNRTQGTILQNFGIEIKKTKE